MKAPAKQGPEKARRTVDELTAALADPFPPEDVKWKPQAVSGNRARAVAYVDARVIQDRLDDVLGVEGWQDNYKCLPDGSVICRLRLRLGEEWVTKVDVGGPSEQPDGGDRLKAAFSDALKRAAVKFGIGRYLYRLPVTWVDYDAQRKQIARTPSLPDFALPAKAKAKDKEPVPAKPAPPPTPPKPVLKPAAHALPATGEELQKRLQDYEAKLVAQGVCSKGALLEHITQAGAKAGHGSDLATWTGAAIALAAEETKVFEAQARKKRTDKKEVA